MQSEIGEHGDPRWDLTLEIASRLWFYGEYAFQVAPNPQQELVDLHWAALQAGRLLGGRAKVKVARPFFGADPTVTVTITFADPDGRARARAQDGVDALLRSVQEHLRH